MNNSFVGYCSDMSGVGTNLLSTSYFVSEYFSSGYSLIVNLSSAHFHEVIRPVFDALLNQSSNLLTRSPTNSNITLVCVYIELARGCVNSYEATQDIFDNELIQKFTKISENIILSKIEMKKKDKSQILPNYLKKYFMKLLLCIAPKCQLIFASYSQILSQNSFDKFRRFSLLFTFLSSDINCCEKSLNSLTQFLSSVISHKLFTDFSKLLGNIVRNAIKRSPESYMRFIEKSRDSLVASQIISRLPHNDIYGQLSMVLLLPSSLKKGLFNGLIESALNMIKISNLMLKSSSSSSSSSSLLSSDKENYKKVNNIVKIFDTFFVAMMIDRKNVGFFEPFMGKIFHFFIEFVQSNIENILVFPKKAQKTFLVSLPLCVLFNDVDSFMGSMVSILITSTKLGTGEFICRFLDRKCNHHNNSHPLEEFLYDFPNQIFDCLIEDQPYIKYMFKAFTSDVDFFTFYLKNFPEILCTFIQSAKNTCTECADLLISYFRLPIEKLTIDSQFLKGVFFLVSNIETIALTVALFRTTPFTLKIPDIFVSISHFMKVVLLSNTSANFNDQLDIGKQNQQDDVSAILLRIERAAVSLLLSALPSICHKAVIILSNLVESVNALPQIQVPIPIDCYQSIVTSCKNRPNVIAIHPSIISAFKMVKKHTNNTISIWKAALSYLYTITKLIAPKLDFKPVLVAQNVNKPLSLLHDELPIYFSFLLSMRPFHDSQLFEYIKCFLTDDEFIGRLVVDCLPPALLPQSYEYMTSLLTQWVMELQPQQARFDVSPKNTIFIKNSMKVMRNLLNQPFWTESSLKPSILSQLGIIFTSYCNQLSVGELHNLCGKFIIALAERVIVSDLPLNSRTQMANHLGMWASRPEPIPKSYAATFFEALSLLVDEFEFQDTQPNENNTNSDLNSNPNPNLNSNLNSNSNSNMNSNISSGINSNLNSNSSNGNNAHIISSNPNVNCCDEPLSIDKFRFFISCAIFALDSQPSLTKEIQKFLIALFRNNIENCLNHCISFCLTSKPIVKATLISAIATVAQIPQIVNESFFVFEPELSLLDILFLHQFKMIKLLIDIVPFSKAEAVAFSLLEAAVLKHCEYEFIDFMVQTEVSLTHGDSMNALFRGNGIASKAVGYFPRLFGRQWMVNNLRPIIEEMIDMNENHNVHFDITENSDNFRGFLNKLIIALIDSLPAMPQSIAKVINILNLRINEKFQGLSISIIFGFLFLRFILPAFNVPKLIGLPELLPDEQRQCLLAVSVILMCSSLHKSLKEKGPNYVPFDDDSMRASVKFTECIENILCIDSISSIDNIKTESIEIDENVVISNLTSHLAYIIQPLTTKIQELSESKEDDELLESSKLLLTYLQEKVPPKPDENATANSPQVENTPNSSYSWIFAKIMNGDYSNEDFSELSKWFFFENGLFYMITSLVPRVHDKKVLYYHIFNEIQKIKGQKQHYSVLIDLSDCKESSYPKIQSIYTLLINSPDFFYENLKRVCIINPSPNIVSLLLKKKQLINSTKLLFVKDMKTLTDEFGKLSSKLPPIAIESITAPESIHPAKVNHTPSLVRIHEKSIQLVQEHGSIYAQIVIPIDTITDISLSQKQKKNKQKFVLTQSNSFRYTIKADESSNLLSLIVAANQKGKSMKSVINSRFNIEKSTAQWLLLNIAFAMLSNDLISSTSLNCSSSSSQSISLQSSPSSSSSSNCNNLFFSSIQLLESVYTSYSFKRTFNVFACSNVPLPCNATSFVKTLSRDLAKNNADSTKTFLIEFFKMVDGVSSEFIGNCLYFIQPWLENINNSIQQDQKFNDQKCNDQKCNDQKQHHQDQDSKQQIPENNHFCSLLFDKLISLHLSNESVQHRFERFVWSCFSSEKLMSVLFQKLIKVNPKVRFNISMCVSQLNTQYASRFFSNLFYLEDSPSDSSSEIDFKISIINPLMVLNSFDTDCIASTIYQAIHIRDHFRGKTRQNLSVLLSNLLRLSDNSNTAQKAADIYEKEFKSTFEDWTKAMCRMALLISKSLEGTAQKKSLFDYFFKDLAQKSGSQKIIAIIFATGLLETQKNGDLITFETVSPNSFVDKLINLWDFSNDDLNIAMCNSLSRLKLSAEVSEKMIVISLLLILSNRRKSSFLLLNSSLAQFIDHCNNNNNVNVNQMNVNANNFNNNDHKRIINEKNNNNNCKENDNENVTNNLISNKYRKIFDILESSTKLPFKQDLFFAIFVLIGLFDVNNECKIISDRISKEGESISLFSPSNRHKEYEIFSGNSDILKDHIFGDMEVYIAAVVLHRFLKTPKQSEQFLVAMREMPDLFSCFNIFAKIKSINYSDNIEVILEIAKIENTKMNNKNNNSSELINNNIVISKYLEGKDTAFISNTAGNSLLTSVK